MLEYKISFAFFLQSLEITFHLHICIIYIHVYMYMIHIYKHPYRARFLFVCVCYNIVVSRRIQIATLFNMRFEVIGSWNTWITDCIQKWQLGNEKCFFQTEIKKKKLVKEKESLQQLLLHGKIKAQQNSITFQNSWMDITQVWSLSVEVPWQKALLLIP